MKCSVWREASLKLQIMGGRGRLQGSEKDSEGPSSVSHREVLGGGHLYSTQPWKCFFPALGRKDWSKQPPPIHPSLPHPPLYCPPPIHPFCIHRLPSFSPSNRPSRLTDIYCLRSTFCKGSSAGGSQGERDRSGNAQRACDLSWGLLSSRGALGHVWPRAQRLRVSL